MRSRSPWCSCSIGGAAPPCARPKPTRSRPAGAARGRQRRASAPQPPRRPARNQHTESCRLELSTRICAFRACFAYSSHRALELYLELYRTGGTLLPLPAPSAVRAVHGMCRAADNAPDDADTTVSAERPTTAPPDDLVLPPNDLALEADELEMLKTFRACSHAQAPAACPLARRPPAHTRSFSALASQTARSTCLGCGTAWSTPSSRLTTTPTTSFATTRRARARTRWRRCRRGCRRSECRRRRSWMAGTASTRRSPPSRSRRRRGRSRRRGQSRRRGVRAARRAPRGQLGGRRGSGDGDVHGARVKVQ